MKATPFVRIQLASDLHLEFLEGRSSQTLLVEPAPGADLLVLAGDIHNGVKGIEAFAYWPVPVVYLAGNHEFYDHDWESTRRDFRAACAGTNVIFLDNDSFEFEGVRILGCTLWTDFRLRGTTQAQAMATVERGLMDYHVIRTASGLLRAQQTLADHEQSRAWLEGELAKPFNGRTVVVTHHGPHPLSIHPRFVGNPLNPGFVSDQSPLLFRFVRHLPAQRQGAAHGSGLRAGVGQTSGEETAGRTAVVRSRYGAMAIVGVVLLSVVAVRWACSSTMPRVRPSARLARLFAGCVVRRGRGNRQQQDTTVHADTGGRRISQRWEEWRACAVMAQAQAWVVHGLTARA